MSARTTEERLAALEAEVARLKARLARKATPNKPWWQLIAGTFAHDPMYEEAMRLGREWRESFRPKRRKRKKPSRASHS